MADSNYADREKKDHPWERMSKNAFDFKGRPFNPASEHYCEIANALQLDEPSLKDKAFYLKIDALIEHYKSLDKRRSEYAQKKEKKRLESLSRNFTGHFNRLAPASSKRLLLALGKELYGAKGSIDRLKAGEEALSKIHESIKRATRRFKRQPRGSRKLENARWLTKKLTTLLYEEKKVRLSNSSRDYISKHPGRKSNPGPRNFLNAVFRYAGDEKDVDQLNKLIRGEMKNRKRPRPAFSEDSEDSDNAEN